jgi:TonB family protein
MNTVSMGGDWVGRNIEGRFTLLERLGGSPEAAVFSTEWVSMTEKDAPPRRAAIKLVPAGEDAETRIAAWQAAASFSHPNLIQVFACGRTQIDSTPLLYIVTEFADEILADILAERSLTAEETAEMLTPALDALAYLHGKGFVHCRLRPSNIVAIGDRLKLTADGLVPVGATRKSATELAIYDAPETVAGPVGPAADLWSLGVTLVKVLTQHLPSWDGTADNEPQTPAALPEPFAGIVRDCLHADPARRATLAAIQARLAPAPPVEPVAGVGQDMRKHIFALLAVVALAIAGVAFWQVSSHREDDQGTPAATGESSSQPNPSTPAKPHAGVTRSGAQSVDVANATPTNEEIDVVKTANKDVVKQVQPEVLSGALASIRGEVTVSIRVTANSSGDVTAADFVTPGPSKYFAGKALDAARQWKFRPATAEEGNAPRVWFLNFAFTPSGIEIGCAAAAH